MNTYTLPMLVALCLVLGAGTNLGSAGSNSIAADARGMRSRFQVADNAGSGGGSNSRREHRYSGKF